MSSRLTERASSLLGAKTSRRGFLMRSAMVGSALAVSPFRFLTRPGTAYAAICACAGADCDCGSACCDGYTDFCCSVNNGANTCPPGTFEAGWWRADGSSFCAGGPRYYVDCNASCGSSVTYPCECGRGDCDNRRAGCNLFRYGNCNAHVECYGAIVCRVVSCTPPYQTYAACDQTTLWDNSTAEHSANCGPVEPPVPPPLGRGQVQVSHSGKVLDVAEASQADGATIWQWSPTGGRNQRWTAEPQTDGSFRIVASHSGKVLDVAEFSLADGGRVHQWTWHGGANQRWTIESVGDGYIKITNVNSGKVLDVRGFAQGDGGVVQQWSWSGGANQRWRGLEPGPSRPLNPGVEITAAHSGKALDVSQVSLADGAVIWQWTPTNGQNQRWVVDQQSDGTYRIVAVHSGKVLDVAEFSTADGGRIHQWAWHGGANQRWRIEPLVDGTARIVSVHSGKVLDVSQVSQADGAVVHQWTWHGGANQRWRGVT
ncbi:MAG TPA: RICIN domain-containing protein [Acidimicrobiales bacterium]